MARAAGAFLGAGLGAGGAALVLATPEHGEAILSRLRAQGLDVEAIRADGRFQLLDARATLEGLLRDGGEGPDPERFRAHMEAILDALPVSGREVRVFGEMVGLLWRDGKGQAAHGLESLWNGLQAVRRFALLCAYPMDAFRDPERGHDLARICDAHGAIHPPEPGAGIAEAEGQPVVAMLKRRTESLENEVTERKSVEASLREAQAELERQLDDMRRLQELNGRIASATGPDPRPGPGLVTLLEEVLRATLAMYGTDKGFLCLFDPALGGLRPEVAAGYGPEFLPGLGAPLPDAYPSSRVLASGQPLVVEDLDAHPEFREYAAMVGAQGLRALHVLPLANREGKVIGTLAIHFPEPRKPTERESRLAFLYARQAAEMIEQARLRERADRELAERRQVEADLRERARALSILNRVGGVLAAERDLQTIVQAVTDAGREITGAGFGAFFYNVKDARGESYMLYTLSGAPREAFSRFPMPRNTALFDHTFSGKGVMRIADVLKDPRYGLSAPYHGMPPGHLPVRSYLAAPVASRSGEVLGGLFYGHPEPDRFAAESEGLLATLAAQAAIAIENSNLYAALERDLERHQKAREASARLAAIVRYSYDAIISKDLNGIIQTWNQAAERIFGYTAAEIIGKPVLVLIPENHQDEEPEILRRIRAGEAIDHYETVRRRKDGTVIEVSLTVSPIKDEDGNITGASKIVRDITEQKKILAVLGESERRFRDMADSAPVFVWMTDAEGRYLYLNKPLLEFAGLPPEAGAGPEWMGRVHPEDAPRRREAFAAALAGRAPLRLEFRLRRRDGAYRWLLDSGHPRFASDGGFMGFVGSAVDITDVKETEEQLRQAQKMEAVGRLAGGVAHDFNNLLTSINGFAEMALELAGGDGTLAEFLGEIRRSGERAASLTQQLLAYSRKQILAPKVFNLNDTVAEMERMLKRLIGEDIELRSRLDPGLGAIKADPGQVQQIILNLALNARDAMPGGGSLTLATSEVVLDRDYAEANLDASAGPHALLAVADTGTGMSPEVKARIFEPFFTTKEVGKGTGLGLSSVYGIVKQSGGSIAVESEPGRGTTFRIYFPIVDEDAAPGRAAAGGGRSARGRVGTVLLAEDEDAVRRFVARTLSAEGYTVLEAKDGASALALGEKAGRLPLLITDMVMPNIGGDYLARRLRLRHPGLGVLYISGHTNDVLPPVGLRDGATRFLQKPFGKADLLRELDGLSGQAARGARAGASAPGDGRGNIAAT